jgi:hypothetical protein
MTIIKLKNMSDMELLEYAQSQVGYAIQGEPTAQDIAIKSMKDEAYSLWYYHALCDLKKNCLNN